MPFACTLRILLCALYIGRHQGTKEDNRAHCGKEKLIRDINVLQPIEETSKKRKKLKKEATANQHRGPSYMEEQNKERRKTVVRGQNARLLLPLLLWRLAAWPAPSHTHHSLHLHIMSDGEASKWRMVKGVGDMVCNAPYLPTGNVHDKHHAHRR